MKKGRLKRGIALLLSTMTLSMSVIPHLPPNILTAYAFHMTFNTSTSGDGHYDISGRVEGEKEETDFLCMKKGASAKSAYNYFKTNNDVNYSEGSLEHKRLFWAYLLTYGNTPGIHPKYPDHSIENIFKRPYAGNTKIAKEVAWSHGTSNGGSALIENLAHDGFMSLENIPAGCKSPNDVFNSTSKYGTPEKAISVDALKSGPNTVDAKLLYDMAGLQDWATFQKYCTITASLVKGTGPASSGVEYPVRVDINDAGFGWTVLNPENGFPVAKLEHDPIIFHVEYNPSIFKVINVTGLIEYFETNDAGGKDSQPFYRAFGKVEVTKPQFYMTTQWKPNSSDVPGGGGSSGGGGGDLDEVDSITVKIYDHSETFNSHYKVDLTKYDYETGEPLKDSIWQVLEAFPDKDQIGTDDETNGQLVESKMREAPTTWDDWLIFEEDMATDENGYISHADERFYDFDHKYCDGHPIPPEPEDEDDDGDTRSARSSDDDDDDDDDEYAELMKEWQAAVDECEAAAASSNGTFHHWMCNSEEKPSEEEAFENSGCREARDNAYQNFINLRYSYTFREVDPRDGYILHAPSGHPDDVPVEIVTMASSEAEKEYEWTNCTNEDIVVAGKAESSLGGGNDSGDDGDDGDDTDSLSLNSNERFFMKSKRVKTADYSDLSQRLYLTEKYELSWGEQIVNALRKFVGLPEEFVEENNFSLNIVAEYDEVEEDLPLDEEELIDDGDLIDDVEKPTAEIKETESKDVTEETKSVEETKPTEKETAAAVEPSSKDETKEETKAKETEKASEKETVSETKDKSEEPETKAEKATKAADDEKATVEDKNKKDDEDVKLSISPKKVPLTSAKNPEEDEEDDEEEEDSVATSPNMRKISAYSFERSAATFSLDDEDDDPGTMYSEDDGGYINLDDAIPDSQPAVTPGPADNIGHSFKVYDHRVPGQIHFNKKDMLLAAGENNDYNAYGDTQGDSTLEGAVYGLFAADDIYGPDTQRDESGNVTKGTGVIFDANDLVAVATTDKNGDGSFLAITEKPHTVYNYKEGKIVYTRKSYPKNLYDADTYRKEYDDEETGRIYTDNVTTNGDYWIGRPLILGNYYIKELTRSEGFELSISGKDMEVTNPTNGNRNEYGETDDTKTNPQGSAWVKEKLKHVVTFPEGNAAYGKRENLFDIAVGSNNATNGFNVVFDGIPEGADFYFDNVTTKDVTVQVPDGGTWEDATTAPLYLTADGSTTPKKDIDGNPIANPNAVPVPSAFTGVGVEAKKITSTTAQPSGDAQYTAAFTTSAANVRYVKYELEQMMRSMGIKTPKDRATGLYSQADFPVYDEPSSKSSGMPEEIITISNVTTNASLIKAILDYYVARVSARNTSRLGCDGSGAVVRNPENHSLCTFRTGKQYNCDLSASYNIGARYFIRELLKPLPETERSSLEAKVPAVKRRTSCVYADLRKLYVEVNNLKAAKTQADIQRTTCNGETSRIRQGKSAYPHEF